MLTNSDCKSGKSYNPLPPDRDDAANESIVAANKYSVRGLIWTK